MIPPVYGPGSAACCLWATHASPAPRRPPRRYGCTSDILACGRREGASRGGEQACFDDDFNAELRHMQLRILCLRLSRRLIFTVRYTRNGMPLARLGLGWAVQLPKRMSVHQSAWGRYQCIYPLPVTTDVACY